MAFLKPGNLYNSLTCDSFINVELRDTKWLVFRNHAVCRLKNVNLQDRRPIDLPLCMLGNSGGTWNIHLDKANGELIAICSNFSKKKVGKSPQIRIPANKPAYMIFILLM